MQHRIRAVKPDPPTTKNFMVDRCLPTNRRLPKNRRKLIGVSNIREIQIDVDLTRNGIAWDKASPL
jgi:hypothetical protein